VVIFLHRLRYPREKVPLSTVKKRVYTLQTVWRRKRRETFNFGITTRQLARSRSPYWAIQVTDDDDSSSRNNNKNNNWYYTRQFYILYESPFKKERSTKKYKWQWILRHYSSEDDASSSYRFLILSHNYEGQLESKERFAIKKYLLIIGKKKNMQVLSHTYTYFST